MIQLFFTKNERVYEKLKSILKCDREIKRTANGKPYIDGFNFSITHTGDVALIAIADSPVGVDAELIKPRKTATIINRFTPRERAEIGTDAARFFQNWVVKEAYIKMLGGTLAHDLKNLEYVGGELFFNGKKADCNIFLSRKDNLIYAVCANENAISECVL